jgi:clan AA aspartic protease (TIGR02281 family)
MKKIEIKRFFILALLLFCLVGILNAQKVKRPDTYNYNRGLEAVENDEDEEALEYFNKELQDNPKNGYAFAWIALLRYTSQEYGRALTAVENALKYLPKKDGEYMAFAYGTRARINHMLDEEDKAIEDMTTSISYKDDDPDLYKDRAELYYYMEQYALSDKDYEKIKSLDPGSTLGYMGVGRNAKTQGRYEDAIKEFDYVLKLAPDYAQGYAFRAESLLGLGRYAEAMDDVIAALNKEESNQKAYHLISEIAKEAQDVAIAKLRIQAVKDKTNLLWPYAIGGVYYNDNQYTKAIDYYKQSNEISPMDQAYYFIAQAYLGMGDYQNALANVNEALDLDPTDGNYMTLKASIFYNNGQNEEADKTIRNFIEAYPDNYFGYYLRGWYHDMNGDSKGALEDYDMSIALEPSEAYTYMCRGRLYMQLGNQEKAKKDLEKAIELDSIPSSNCTAAFGYLYLGQNDKAIDWLNRSLEADDGDGTYYNAACIYSIMGETDKAVENLRMAFEKGHRSLRHIENDKDLDNIRNLPAFKALIEKYRQEYEFERESNTDEQVLFEERVAEIPFTKEGGVYKVKCEINELPLYFVFDTGASDVSMSTVEATFMMKNNYLSPRDIIGRQNYMNANGEISEGTVINLKNVNFGGLNLKDVRASVVKSQVAPLLLGQSVLNRLGKIEIDYDRSILKVTYKEKAK